MTASPFLKMACPGLNKDYVEKEKPLPVPEVLEANLGAEVGAALQFFPPLSFEPLRSATLKSARRFLAGTRKFVE